MTIKDIARIANVSVSTVSYALRGDSRISDATRERIEGIAKEIGYNGSSGANHKNNREQKNVVFFTHDIEGTFIVNLIRAMKNVFEFHDYNFYISTGDKIAVHDWMSGMVILNNEIDGEQIKELEGENIPIILMDRELSQRNARSVVIDNFNGEYQITKKALDRGCEKIVYVSGAVNYYDSDMRYKGYKQAVEDAGRNISDMLFVRGDCTYDGGFKAASFIQNSGRNPDAYICANDEMAKGVLDFYDKNGIHAPKNLFVTGFDGTILTEREKYHFMTAYPQDWNWGDTVAYSLIEMMEHGMKKAENIIFPVTISDEEK